MLLQEILRNHWDYYVEELEACPPEDPHVVCVRKGGDVTPSILVQRLICVRHEYTRWPGAFSSGAFSIFASALVPVTCEWYVMDGYCLLGYS
jgi:hypothetical protein